MHAWNTERLVLRAMEPADAEALFLFLGDPTMWWYDPDLVHPDLQRTRDYVARAHARWATDALSYWTVRLRETAEVVGSGGVQIHERGEWNLNYRIAPPHQGRGYAGEVASAAVTAAARHDAHRPIVAWIDEVNTPSIRVAERAGMRPRGLRTGTFDGRPRLAYSDRPLDDVAFPPHHEAT